MPTVEEFLPPRSHPFDPPEVLAELRAAGQLGTAILWDGRRVWLVTRYADVRFVLGDPRFSSDIDNPGLPALRPGQGIARHRAALVRKDNPRHGELRRMVAPAFTPSRVHALRPV